MYGWKYASMQSYSSIKQALEKVDWFLLAGVLDKRDERCRILSDQLCDFLNVVDGFGADFSVGEADFNNRLGKGNEE